MKYCPNSALPGLLRYTLVLWVAFAALPLFAAIDIGKDYDVLNLPAMKSPLAAKTTLNAITRAGDRIIAVGHRGHIIYSDDNGESWTQADVPVRSDLTSIKFPTATKGWVGGHEGVILHTTDGGETWTKQLDGYQYNELALAHYTRLAEENPEESLYPILVDEALFALEQGADRPWFAIEFNERNEGYAIGAYGLIAATPDEGKSWIPLIELVENHDGFNHIFAYEKLGVDDFVLVGERGSVWHQAELNSRFTRLSPFYDGSLYTVVSTADNALVVAGMRGNAFRSTDKGYSWQELELPVQESIVASQRLQDGRLVLVSVGGSVLLSDDNGEQFNKLDIGPTWPYTDLIEVEPGVLLMTGLRGVRKLSLNNTQ